MRHKAFAFDRRAFDERLAHDLRRALASGEVARLVAFIEASRAALRWPDSGEPVGVGWADAMTMRDPQEYADLALTAFYDPREDFGLGGIWQSVQGALGWHGLDPAIVLGTPFGPRSSLFDPGGMGSYFQTAAEVAERLRALLTLAPASPDETKLLAPAVAMFRRAAAASSGLYVTF
jgi:hypothetical protein